MRKTTGNEERSEAERFRRVLGAVLAAPRGKVEAAIEDGKEARKTTGWRRGRRPREAPTPETV